MDKEAEREYQREYYKRPGVKERKAERDRRPEVKERRAEHYMTNKREIRGKRWKANRANWYYELKSTLCCSVCGESRSPCLEFHHRDPKQKLFTIATAAKAGPGKYTKELILAEIEKCDVLCRNCHAMLHWGGEDEGKGGIQQNKTGLKAWEGVPVGSL